MEVLLPFMALHHGEDDYNGILERSPAKGLYGADLTSLDLGGLRPQDYLWAVLACERWLGGLRIYIGCAMRKEGWLCGEHRGSLSGLASLLGL
jgi:hypothetical protein